MKAISEYASENGIEKIICLGDLFHNRSHLTLDVLHAVHSFFKEENNEWIMFPGNHDMFMKSSWNINSVRPFEQYITVYDKIDSFELDGRRFIIVPFMHNETDYMKVIRKLEDKFSEESILLTHIGINNAVNNSCFLLKHWSNVNLSDVKFSLVLSGHFHNYQVIDNKICYPGSPIPFRFDEGMVPHGFIDLDTDTLEVNFIDLREIRDDCPHDFVTIVDDMLEDENLANMVKGNKVRVALNREYSTPELDKIRKSIIDVGALSTQWMKLKIDESTGSIDINSPESERPFITWLEDQDNGDKYDEKLLLELYSGIVDEAEDLYSQSLDYE
jgi:DNA repair exonuclease SbcCD nuclease subunit